MSTSQASDRVVTIGVAHFPPYSFAEEGNIAGVEVEIIRESLSAMGYWPEFVGFPYGRLPIAFTNKQVDASIVTMKSYDGLEVFYSDIVLPEYQTVAIQINNREGMISGISDLKGKSILAHQRANQFYGVEFSNIAEENAKNEKYHEIADQQRQVEMLFRNRVEVIVLAYEIFLYYKEISEFRDTDIEYNVSRIFGNKFGFHNVFWDETVRNDFEEGLKHIKENGTYEHILRKYLKDYHASKN
ncbi:transporter substrate-binding domain-containing protein [Alteromonas sp. KUL49]|uniref:substrate-binding periplasmic protein n=1 Tax=Alteromonas sp. KUL49 TaxID=2480798 RepID=UPI0010FFBE5B|nr:transporter substrate-binding domain-containing protein [Alteromonas sp. KUL49]GEA12978.1 hypothetical protein KUL49_33530 [Alteromonas sp. KUL49]